MMEMELSRIISGIIKEDYLAGSVLASDEKSKSATFPRLESSNNSEGETLLSSVRTSVVSESVQFENVLKKERERLATVHDDAYENGRRTSTRQETGRFGKGKVGKKLDDNGSSKGSDYQNLLAAHKSC